MLKSTVSGTNRNLRLVLPSFANQHLRKTKLWWNIDWKAYALSSTWNGLSARYWTYERSRV